MLRSTLCALCLILSAVVTVAAQRPTLEDQYRWAGEAIGGRIELIARGKECSIIHGLVGSAKEKIYQVVIDEVYYGPAKIGSEIEVNPEEYYHGLIKGGDGLRDRHMTGAIGEKLIVAQCSPDLLVVDDRYFEGIRHAAQLADSIDHLPGSLEEAATKLTLDDPVGVGFMYSVLWRQRGGEPSERRNALKIVLAKKPSIFDEGTTKTLQQILDRFNEHKDD